MSHERYLLAWKGRQFGPLSLDEIRGKLANREIGLMHQVQSGGRWVTLDEFLSGLQQEKTAADKVAQAKSERDRMEQQLRSEREQREAQVAAEQAETADLLQRVRELEQRPLSPPTRESGISGSDQGRAARTSGLAITALVMGILNFVPGVNLITWIFALIFGHVALSQIKGDPSLRGRGMALTGLIITYVLLGLGLIFGFLIGFTHSS